MQADISRNQDSAVPSPIMDNLLENPVENSIVNTPVEHPIMDSSLQNPLMDDAQQKSSATCSPEMSPTVGSTVSSFVRLEIDSENSLSQVPLGNLSIDGEIGGRKSDGSEQVQESLDEFQSANDHASFGDALSILSQKDPEVKGFRDLFPDRKFSETHSLDIPPFCPEEPEFNNQGYEPVSARRSCSLPSLKITEVSNEEQFCDNFLKEVFIEDPPTFTIIATNLEEENRNVQDALASFNQEREALIGSAGRLNMATEHQQRKLHDMVSTHYVAVLKAQKEVGRLKYAFDALHSTYQNLLTEKANLLKEKNKLVTPVTPLPMEPSIPTDEEFVKYVSSKGLYLSGDLGSFKTYFKRFKSLTMHDEMRCEQMLRFAEEHRYFQNYTDFQNPQSRIRQYMDVKQEKLVSVLNRLSADYKKLGDINMQLEQDARNLEAKLSNEVTKVTELQVLIAHVQDNLL